jgi:hypothetical protein
MMISKLICAELTLWHVSKEWTTQCEIYYTDNTKDKIDNTK